MAEEEKKQPETKQEEKAAAKPEKAEKSEAPAKAEKPAEAKPDAEKAEKKGKKISQMTLVEVEAELKIVKEKMGAYQSAHARNLLARRDCLSKQ